MYLVTFWEIDILGVDIIGVDIYIDSNSKKTSGQNTKLQVRLILEHSNTLHMPGGKYW